MLKGPSFHKNLLKPSVIQWLDVRLLKCAAFPQTVSGFNPLSLQSFREVRPRVACTVHDNSTRPVNFGLKRFKSG